MQTGLLLDSPDAGDGEGDEEVPLSKWLWSSILTLMTKPSTKS